MSAGRVIPWPRRLRYALETVAAYAVYGFFRVLPLETASDFGGFLLSKIGPHMGLSQKAMANIAFAFPEKTAAEHRRILTDMWDNLGRVVGEYPHLHRIWPHVEMAGEAHLVSRKGQAAIFFAGHLGNWEINTVAARARGVGLTLVYRRPNNPGVDSLLRHARDSGVAGYIAKGPEGGREILSILKKDGAVGMLVDQRMNEGMAIPFFGRDAMTAPAIAHFALRLGCPLYPSRVERLGGAKFRMTVYPALEIEKTGDRDADARRILVQINTLLESWIRERPGQWLWIHRRWPE